MRQITDEQEFRAAVKEDKPTVAVFKTTWCKDCHYLDLFFDDVVSQYADRLNFIHIDRDQLPDLCAELNILGIPSFIVFARGKELVRFVSKLRKTREEVEHFFDRALEVAGAMAER